MNICHEINKLCKLWNVLIFKAFWRKFLNLQLLQKNNIFNVIKGKDTGLNKESGGNKNRIIPEHFQEYLLNKKQVMGWERFVTAK